MIISILVDLKEQLFHIDGVFVTRLWIDSLLPFKIEMSKNYHFDYPSEVEFNQQGVILKLANKKNFIT